MDAEDDLSPEEKKMFNKLSNEAAYDSDFESNIIHQLRKQGLIKDNSKVKSALRWAAIFVSSTGLFLLGVYYGSSVKTKENYSYVLLLRNSENLASNAKERFKEYEQWRKELEQHGIAITGEKLSASIATIGEIEESASPVSGLFMLSAKDDDEAFQLAKESPHVKNGGFIEIKKIVHQ